MKNISIYKDRVIKQKDNQKALFTQRYAKNSNQQYCHEILNSNQYSSMLNKQNNKSLVNQKYRYSTDADFKQNTFQAARKKIQNQNQKNHHFQRKSNQFYELKQSSSIEQKVSNQNQSLHFSKRNPKFNFAIKSNNFQKGCLKNEARYMQKDNLNRLKTQTQEQFQQKNSNIYKNLLHQSCQFIRSETAQENDENISSQAEQLDFKEKQKYIIQNNKFQKNKQANHKIYQSVNFDLNKERPVTFGTMKKAQIQNQMLNFPKGLRQQKKLKNEILEEIIQANKKQLLKSCQFTSNQPRCINHNNKRAKYVLNTQSKEQQQQQNYYCSKCAVNLAKRGFDIQEIPAFSPMKNTKIIQSQQQEFNFQKRRSQIGEFQKRISILQQSIYQKLAMYNQKGEEMKLIDKNIVQTSKIYDQLISVLVKMKSTFINHQNQKNKITKIDISHKKDELSKILQATKAVYRDLGQQKHKILKSKHKQFQFLLNNFSNKIETYQQYVGELPKTKESKSNVFDLQAELELIFQQAYKQYNQIYDIDLSTTIKPKFNSQQSNISLSCHQTSMNGYQLNNNQTYSDRFYCEEEGIGAFRQLFIANKQEKQNGKNLNLRSHHNQMRKGEKLNEVKQKLYEWENGQSLKNAKTTR